VTGDQSIPFYTGTASGLKKGWQAFTSDGRYRIARREDFRMPGWALEKYGAELEYRMSNPVEGIRDFNGDGVWYDTAVIVVDRMRDDAKRFGIVILTSNKDEETLYTARWLWQGRDLSRTFLLRQAEHLSVVELDSENGSHTTCEVRWDSKQNKYFCDP